MRRHHHILERDQPLLRPAPIVLKDEHTDVPVLVIYALDVHRERVFRTAACRCRGISLGEDQNAGDEREDGKAN